MAEQALKVHSIKDIETLLNNAININHTEILVDNILSKLFDFSAKFVGAAIFWWIGSRLINLAITLIDKALKNHVEGTLVRYLNSAVQITLKIVLIVAILGYFGIETNSFAALFAAVGIAIGAAWSGLLANFAAGVFLIFLRPFKVGDFISAAGITGIVEEIGMFTTTINTPDNVKTFVSNNKLFSDNIRNYSTNAYRRVDIVARINYNTPAHKVIESVREKIIKIPNVLSEPAPVLEILEFAPEGIVLAIRPFCQNAHYWQVYFDTTRLISETFPQ